MLSVIGLLHVVLLPLYQVVLIALAWFYNMTLAGHKLVLKQLEFVGHWACMESFILALGIVIYEIGE